MTDEDLAAHLAEQAGRLLVAQREGSFLEGAALGHEADGVANAFILAGLAEWRPDDAILSAVVSAARQQSSAGLAI